MQDHVALSRPIGSPARFAASWVAMGLFVVALLMPRSSLAPAFDGAAAAGMRAAYSTDLAGPSGERLRWPVQPAGLITDLPLAPPAVMLLRPTPEPEQIAQGRAQAAMLTPEMAANSDWRANPGLEISALAARIEALETTVASLKDYLIVVAELQSRGDPARGGRLVDGKVATDILEPPPHAAADRRPLVHLASYRNYEDAETGWRKLAAAYADTLSVADPQFTEIDTDSGRFIRLMAAFPPGSNADRTCRTIQERGFYCRVFAR